MSTGEPFSEDLVSYGKELGPRLYNIHEKPGADHGGANKGKTPVENERPL